MTQDVLSGVSLIAHISLCEKVVYMVVLQLFQAHTTQTC